MCVGRDTWRSQDSCEVDSVLLCGLRGFRLCTARAFTHCPAVLLCCCEKTLAKTNVGEGKGLF